MGLVVCLYPRQTGSNRGYLRRVAEIPFVFCHAAAGPALPSWVSRQSLLTLRDGPSAIVREGLVAEHGLGYHVTQVLIVRRACTFLVLAEPYGLAEVPVARRHTSTPVAPKLRVSRQGLQLFHGGPVRRVLRPHDLCRYPAEVLLVGGIFAAYLFVCHSQGPQTVQIQRSGGTIVPVVSG